MQVDGIDLGLLYECLLPQKHLLLDEGSWDPDTMFNQLKQSMQEESDARVSYNTLQSFKCAITAWVSLATQPNRPGVLPHQNSQRTLAPSRRARINARTW